MNNDAVHARPLAADLGIVFHAPDVGQLFESIAVSTFALLTDLERVEAREERFVHVKGRDTGDLLVRWLSELLAPKGDVPYLYMRFRVGAVDEATLAAVAWGEPFDPSRHTLIRGTHTLTPHDALVSESAQGWSARIVFDENKAPQGSDGADTR